MSITVDRQDGRRFSVSVQPLDQLGGAFFDGVPVAAGIRAQQLLPGGLGVHGGLL